MVFRSLGVACLALLLAMSSWSCTDPSCPSPCQVGIAFCSPQGITSCALRQGSPCPGWQLQLCGAGQTCVVSVTGAPQCQGQAQCQNPYHSKKCVGQSLFWFDDCGRQREVALTCPAGTTCQGEECRQQGSPCVSECGPGQSRCTDSGWLSTCVRKEERCYKWSTPSQCPSGQQCRNNTCQQGPCQDLCPANTTRCQGKGIQVCQRDASGCAKWGAVYDCQPGQVCQQNQCAKARCPASCNITSDCALADCGARTACENGACSEPSGQCKDKCSLNATRCSGLQLQICRREANGCTDWGPPIRCLSGQECQNGQCVASSCPPSCSQDADCQRAACGTRNRCINGACSAGSQPQCPSSCSQGSQCDIAACGARRACINGACAAPQQCPGACSADSQCDIPACGARKACVNGACGVPQQPQCPSSCTQDSQCDIPACGARKACLSGSCSAPQQQCPSSCTQDSQCKIPACGQKTACSQGACSVPSSGGWKYGKNVTFINHPPQNNKSNSSWGSILTDIMRHQLPGQQVLNFTNPVILGHETNHFIQNHFRNKFTQSDGRKVNAFYVLQNRIIKLNEPNFKLSEVAAFVPKILQEGRYTTYLIKQQQHWNDRPLYIVDEWACYTIDSAIAVELSKAGTWRWGSADDVKGPLEFLVYGLALAMATEKKDPTYFKNYTAFLEVTAWMGARGMESHREGLKFQNFQGFNQAKYLKDLQTHADAKPIRDFALRVFGQKWVDQVIFGKP